MSRRIEGGLSTTLNPFGPEWPTAKAEQAQTVGEQIQQTLFGRPKPLVADEGEYPDLVDLLSVLKRYVGKLARMAGDSETDFALVLAIGTIAMIDSQGLIYVGAGFLRAFKDKLEVPVGAVAHEVGHRPKRWSQYKAQRRLEPQEIQMLCRHEETRADIFAGKALAELGFDCEPLITFLLSVEEKPHPEYFPAEVRAEVIRDAHAGRTYRAENRKKIFPAFDRMTSPKGDLGEY